MESLIPSAFCSASENSFISLVGMCTHIIVSFIIVSKSGFVLIFLLCKYLNLKELYFL